MVARVEGAPQFKRGEEINQSEISAEYSLVQNYPNPFNPTTTINYSLAENSFVELKVYDILGREVAQLVNIQKSSGKYEVTFSGDELSSGIYVYRLTAYKDGRILFNESKQMTLMK